MTAEALSPQSSAESAKRTNAQDDIWVEEQYRRQGIDSWLMGEVEREAKESNAYIITFYCCNWGSDFFFHNGFTPRGKLEDYPKGHTAYELEKRI